jgi:hypothetical protein
MAEIPLPSLETLAKLSGWLKQQANNWLDVVTSPKDFVSDIDLDSPAELGKSLQFLTFVIICDQILELPLYALDLQLRVFDPTTQITNVIVEAIEAVVFGSAVWFFGRILRGKGQYRSTLIAVFYATAFTLFFTMGNYAGGYDKQDFLSGSFLSSNPNSDPVRDTITAILAIIIIAYATVKLVPLIKYVHAVGAIRAFTILGLAFAVDIWYGHLVADQFTAQLIRTAMAK